MLLWCGDEDEELDGFNPRDSDDTFPNQVGFLCKIRGILALVAVPQRSLLLWTLELMRGRGGGRGSFMILLGNGVGKLNHLSVTSSLLLARASQIESEQRRLN